MNKRAETLPRNYLYGVVLFTLVIVGGIFLIMQFQEKNAGFVDTVQFSAFNRTFNVESRLSSNVSSLQGRVTGASPDVGTFGVLNGLINTAWNGLVFLFTGFGFMNSVFAGLSSVFGVPAFIPAIISLLVVILFVFAIWSAFFQKDV